MTQAAIKATYSDYRRVKGRKVLQLIFEVPIEQAPEVHKTFGEPAPDGSMWVGIARLQKPETQQAEKQRRSWGELPRSQQAAMKCQDPDFRTFLAQHFDGILMLDLDMAVDEVKRICGVKSRADLNTNTEAAKKWDHLYSDYQLWQRGAAA